jgi:ABC-2 type transport system permease protein
VSLTAFAKLAWLELKLFVREPVAMLFTVGFPLVLMFVIAGVFNVPPGGRGNPFRGVGGAEYYVVSNIGIVIAAIGLIALPGHLTSYFERGIMRRFRASSVTALAVIGAQSLVNLIAALVATLLILLAARPVYTYHSPRSLPGVAIGFVIGMFSFLSIGVLIASLFRSSRAAQGAGLVAFFPAWLISGAGPPLAVLPDTMRHVSDFNPVAYAVRVIQDPWFGFGITVKNVVLLIGVGIVAAAGSLLLYVRRQS